MRERIYYVPRVTVNVNIDIPQDSGDSSFSQEFTLSEVQKAIFDVKSNRAVGIDEIPGEVLKNDSVARFLQNLCNICFRSGTIPCIWNRTLIKPIPKCSTSDIRDPLSYRGIAITPVVYKVYCSLLNKRITAWTDTHNIIFEGQNGFRKGRSTVDHLHTLTSIIETRKKSKLSTYCAFIDFKKAFDTIDRKLLYKKLEKLGFHSKLVKAVKSLYINVMCSVKLNAFNTDWFTVNTGLKQGCSLSPVLFNLYINDLALKLNVLNKGINIDGENVSILLYADDIVIIAATEKDLQSMLDVLNIWCSENFMTVNPLKSNIVHFRNPSIKRSEYLFKIGDINIDYASQYKYLGLLLTEHLDYSITAKTVAQSANRALGLLISKAKSFGGLPYEAFSKLYEATVCPVITYASAVWGTESFSCINAVQNRAARYFLNVGRYTPNAAVCGDIGWKPMISTCWKSVILNWCKLVNMDQSRLNRKVFAWSNVKCGNTCKNWNFRVWQMWKKYNCDRFCDINTPVQKKDILSVILPNVENDFIDRWHMDVNRETARNGNGGNKLRLYQTFKHTFETEFYCTTVFNRAHRGALAKFRSGTAPIRIETGRYNGLPLKDRHCFNCSNVVEDEIHVLLHCPCYNTIRKEVLAEACRLNRIFIYLNDRDKIVYLLSHPEIAVLSAKTCFSILGRRRNGLYN